MARAFNGTSQYLASASALSALAGKSRLAVAFWVNSVFANDDDILLELSANAFSNAGSFVVIGDPSDPANTQFSLRGDVGRNTKLLATKLSDSTWHHVMMNFNFGNPGGGGPANEVETIFIDGSAASVTDTDTFNNTGTFTSQTLYVMSRGGASLFADGAMADLCIWAPTAALGATEAAAMYAGARANTVDSGEILYYWPLGGTTSPEPATVGSIALNVTGATQTADPPQLSALPPLVFTATKTDSTHVSVAWTLPDATITNGVTILRAAGDQTTTLDGAGKSPGTAGYDPSTIAGTAVVATGRTSSPYADTLPTPGVYTYWIVRTA